jgi:hypothetical protein
MLFVACAGESVDRAPADDVNGLEQPASDVTDSASVKIVSFTDLPPVEAADWQWGVDVRWSIPTESPGVDPIVFNPRRLAPLGDSLVAVLDAADYRIVILETPSGRVRSRFGRAGAGPGEVMDPVGLLWGDSVGSLWVADRANRRVSRFEQSGALVAETPLPAAGGASGVGTWEAVRGSNTIAPTSPPEGGPRPTVHAGCTVGRTAPGRVCHRQHTFGYLSALQPGR